MECYICGEEFEELVGEHTCEGCYAALIEADRRTSGLTKSAVPPSDIVD